MLDSDHKLMLCNCFISDVNEAKKHMATRTLAYKKSHQSKKHFNLLT